VPQSACLALIPGLNNTAAVFDAVKAAMSPDIAAIALDNPALETVEAIAQHHLAVLPERFWLAGFSFGGYVALAMLQAAPERVQGIALICTSPLADSPEAAARRQTAIQTAMAGGYHAMIESQGAQAFHPDSLKNAALMQARRAMVQQYGPQTFVAHVRATIARPDRSALLDGRRPTLVVGASHDALFTPAAMAWADRMPGVRRVTLNDAGHLLPMEQPAALAQTLEQWMHH